jgi:ATP-binding cassette subfamily F protein 3
MSGNVLIRFDEVDFDFGHNKPILSEVNFSVRRGSKIALMGQNGAGKSTIFGLLTDVYHPHEGKIVLDRDPQVAIARQVLSKKELDMSVREYFQSAFSKKVYDIDPRIDEVLRAVNLKASKDRLMKTFSGGQKARLLLAYALVSDPDLLLLDEPTNNLDPEGVKYLESFLKEYNKTCIVISHDSRFLNTFTDGVLYLDAFTKKVEQYTGNYHDVVREIGARIEKEKRENRQLEKGIEARKEKANFFANKGGQMRARAKKMREETEDMEDSKVEVRREDKTIPNFTIPLQSNIGSTIVKFHTIPVLKKGQQKHKKVRGVELYKGDKLLVQGPNGIGKTTFLEAFINSPESFAEINTDIRIGYYAQDFSSLDYDKTVLDFLYEKGMTKEEQKVRATAAKFLISGDMVYKKIETLSEGQKGLVALAGLVLGEPGLVILDEPTNHINFRHLPVIAKAIKEFEGAVILVSHDDAFVKEIGEMKTLDLGTL